MANLQGEKSCRNRRFGKADAPYHLTWSVLPGYAATAFSLRLREAFPTNPASEGLLLVNDRNPLEIDRSNKGGRGFESLRLGNGRRNPIIVVSCSCLPSGLYNTEELTLLIPQSFSTVLRLRVSILTA